MRTPRILLWPLLTAVSVVDLAWWTVKLPFRAAWVAITWSANLDLETRRDLPPDLTEIGFDDPGHDVDHDDTRGS